MAGNETLQRKLEEVKEARVEDKIKDLRVDISRVETAHDKLQIRFDALHKAFVEERVSSAKSLGSAAAGGGATAGMIEIIMHLIQSGS